MRLKNPRAHLGVLVGVLTVLYATYSIRKHSRLLSSSFDLGIFDQAVRAYSRFEVPRSAIKNESLNLLGDHFHPILALLAPLYWIRDRPYMLLIAQAILVAVSVIPVYGFARRLTTHRNAMCAAVAYGLSWGLQNAVAFDFHEIAFAVPIVAWMIERTQAKRFGTAALLALSLLLVKEDLAPVVAAFGIYLIILGRRRLGAALAVTGVVAFLVLTKWLMPWLAGGLPFAYWTYDALGADLPSAVAYMVRHPFQTVRMFFVPARKSLTLAWVVFPWAFTGLLSPILILAIPQLAERFLSSKPVYWTTDHHYSAVLMPIAALAAIDGLHRFAQRSTRAEQLWSRWARGTAAFALITSIGLPVGALASPATWQTTNRMRAGRAALAVIPAGVRVEADNRLGPHLTHRDTVLLLDGIPKSADFVLADVKRRQFPYKSTAEARAYVISLLDQGWTLVFQQEGFVVLRRPAF